MIDTSVMKQLSNAVVSTYADRNSNSILCKIIWWNIDVIIWRHVDASSRQIQKVQKYFDSKLNIFPESIFNHLWAKYYLLMEVNFRVCSPDKMIQIYIFFLCLSNVWSMLHRGSVGRVYNNYFINVIFVSVSHIHPPRWPSYKSGAMKF